MNIYDVMAHGFARLLGLLIGYKLIIWWIDRKTYE